MLSLIYIGGRMSKLSRFPGLLEVGLDLPVLVGDDDFLEHLHENSFTEVIDVNDLIFEWSNWAKENVEA
jgi:hypothetical protein